LSLGTDFISSDRLVSLGSHRWWFKPEVGVSNARDPWTLELRAAVTFYTDNNNFYGENERSQQPCIRSMFT